MLRSSHGREDCSMQWILRQRWNSRQTSLKTARLVADLSMRVATGYLLPYCGSLSLSLIWSEGYSLLCK